MLPIRDDIDDDQPDHSDVPILHGTLQRCLARERLRVDIALNAIVGNFLC